jgi:putative ABC transport system permease protein
MFKILVGWLQLKKEKVRFAVAVVGVAFAVILVMMQIGFRDSLLDTSLRYHELGIYDIALVSPTTTNMTQSKPFSSRRLYQALALEEVVSVTPVYGRIGNWKDPVNGEKFFVYTIGIDPAVEVFDIPGINSQRDVMKKKDYFLYDALSRPELGPVPRLFAESGSVDVDVNDMTIEVHGLFQLGTSFGILGSLVSSVDNFLRLFPDRSRGMIDVGFVRLAPDADPKEIRDRLSEYLPGDVSVLTKEGFKNLELKYWDTISPVGGVFGFGIVVGLVVGAIIVYQILFADVNDHMNEYATLKAMGYSNTFLASIVVQQAVILAVLGFSLGGAISWYLYRLVGGLIHVEMAMTLSRMLSVLALTLGMCTVSALLAQRKVHSADPAEVF